MTWNKWHIEYCNPNIPGDPMRVLRGSDGNPEVVCGRNDQEARRAAGRRLASTGMMFGVVRAEPTAEGECDQ